MKDIIFKAEVDGNSKRTLSVEHGILINLYIYWNEISYNALNIHMSDPNSIT